ncbi:MAG: phosphodiester glycosidase family protein [Anaerolineae bacterium]
MTKRSWLAALIRYTWIALLAIAGCAVPGIPDIPSGNQPAPRPLPVTLIAPPTPAPQATASLPEAGWQTLRPGIQFRRASVDVGDWVDWLVLLRVDPAHADFQVRYQPETPRQVRDWQLLAGAEAGAAAVVNAGFFNQDNRITGLLISDGQVYGQTYRGFGGMFFVRDGQPVLHWLAEHPYQSDPRIVQAIQSFPMLVRAGQVIDGIPASAQRSRRSFVGIDWGGRVVFGVTTMPVWSLTALADYLVHRSDLALDSALNLDGGASSGIWVSGVPDGLLVNSIDKVPAVIAIIPRQ